MKGPLSGVRVIDLSRVLAGPWAGQLLADYGADVIKIEKPATGDDTRHWGPPWLRDTAGNELPDSAYFLATNRNKRSVTCNLAHPDGRAIVRRLVAEADVLLENFRVGTLARYGLDATTLGEMNPRLVYCSITAYGQTGSRAQEPGYDAMIQASGGLMSITGESSESGGRPQKVGVAIADIMAGMYASTAIIAALFERETTGRGQHIDVPLFDCQVAWLANQAMNYLVGGEVPGRHGTAHPNIVPYQSFATADGELMIAVGNDRQFRACMDALGLDTLAADPRFSSNRKRLENRNDLIGQMAERIAHKSTERWLQVLKGAGVPAGPINDLDRVFADSNVREHGLVRALVHRDAGSVPGVINPVRFEAHDRRAELAPPVLGEHTTDVLRHELGYSPDRIEALRSDGAI